MKLALFLSIFVLALLPSCSTNVTPNPSQTEIKQAGFVNPHPPGTYAHFKADPSYPNTGRTWKNSAVLAQANSSNTSIVIDLSLQRAFLNVGNDLAMDYRVSTGRSSHPTPKGSYKVIEKLADKRSNLYGKMYNAEGNVINSDADTRDESVPEGGKFVGASMPYWMRLTNSGVGMHKGNVSRRYASHGCIRTHYSAVSTVFNTIRLGTPVSIVP